MLRSPLLVRALLIACVVPMSFTAYAQGAPAVDLPDNATELRIAATGRTWGFGSHRSSGATILLLWEYVAERGGGAWIDRSGLGVLRRGAGLLFDPNTLRGSTAVRWLADRSRKKPEKPRKLQLLETDNTLIFVHPDDTDFDVLAAMQQRNARLGDQPDMVRRTATLVPYRRGDSEMWHLQIDGKPLADPGADPVAWDQWWGIRGTAQLGEHKARYFLVIKPWGDASRRAFVLQKLRTKLGLLVSTGSELSTYGWLTSNTSPFRQDELQNLGRHRYDALVPARSELYYGAERLLKDAKTHNIPLLATNLYHASGKQKGKPVTRRTRVATVSGVRVAMLGLVSKRAVVDLHKAELGAALQVRDPVAEVAKALDELRKLPGLRPELVIAITNCRGKALEELVQQSYGLDLVIGQAGRFDLQPPVVKAIAPRRGKERIHGRSPLLIAETDTTRVTEVAVKLRGQGHRAPVEISSRAHLLGPDVGRDEAVHKVVIRRSIATLARRERTLMPALEDLVGDDKELLDKVREDPEFARFLPRAATKRWQQLWFTGRLWSQLMVNVVAEATNAEVAMIPRRKQLSSTVPGPLVEGYVAQWLQTEDAVQLRKLTGAQLKKLSAALADEASVTGMEREKGLVRGRRIQDREVYTVALTRHLARSPAARRALSGTTAQKRFVWRGDVLVVDEAGDKAMLPTVVMRALRRLRKADPKLGKATAARMGTWLRARGSKIEPRWEVALKDVTVSFTQYSNYPSAAWLQFPGVREQRVVTPGNYALGTKLHLRGGYSSSSVSWLSSLQTQFARTVIDLGAAGAPEVTQETADDVLASTEAQFQRAKLQLGPKSAWSLVPFLNATYDTEFTATVNNMTKQPFPHQKELRTTLGVLLRPGGLLRELRLAALTKTDFAAIQGAFEAGVQAGFKAAVPIGRAILAFNGDLRWLAPTDEDTAPDLGTIALGQAKLAVPIARGVAATLMADVFAYIPKLRSIEGPDGKAIQRQGSASLVLAAGLSFKRLWKW